MEDLMRLIDEYAETRHTKGHHSYSLATNSVRGSVITAVQTIKAPKDRVTIYMFRRRGLTEFSTCSESRYHELSRSKLFETKVGYLENRDEKP